MFCLRCVCVCMLCVSLKSYSSAGTSSTHRTELHITVRRQLSFQLPTAFQMLSLFWFAVSSNISLRCCSLFQWKTWVRCWQQSHVCDNTLITHGVTHTKLTKTAASPLLIFWVISEWVSTYDIHWTKICGSFFSLFSFFWCLIKLSCGFLLVQLSPARNFKYLYFLYQHTEINGV